MTSACRIPDCNQPANPNDPLSRCGQHTPGYWAGEPGAGALFDWLALNGVAELIPESPVFRTHEGWLTYTAFEYDGPRDFNGEHTKVVDHDIPRIERTVPLLASPSDEVKAAIVESGGLLITDDLNLHEVSNRLLQHEILKDRLRYHADPDHGTCPVWPCDIAHNLWMLLPDEYPDGPGGISASLSARRRAEVAV